jgi:hypothetical protein
MANKDRREKLLDPSNTTLNGIDFVEIAGADQRLLRVHFLNTVALQGTLTAAPTITGGESVPTVAVLPVNDATDWSADAEGRPVLALSVPAPGDFSFYTLTLASPRLDRYFTQAQFSFKALCDSDLDCAAPAPFCPPPSGDVPPIDYLAKDFLSFRKALSDFSALRYPEWQERSEADFGMMFMEALAGLADDLSYTQDRVAAEATLDTATQRRSIVRHARLVDYGPRPATASQVLLQLDVANGPLPAGLPVGATTPDDLALVFELGTGLLDPATGLLNQTKYGVDRRWNRWQYDASGNPTTANGRPLPNLLPYYWDESDRCLHAGATDAWLLGDGHNLQIGQALLIDSPGPTPADPSRREIIHLAALPEETIDALYGQKVTHITWGTDEALKYDHELSAPEDVLAGTVDAATLLAGNLLPATQGQRLIEAFAIDEAPPGAAGVMLAVARTGANNTLPGPGLPQGPASTQYLYTLGQPVGQALQTDRPAPRLAWLAQPDPEAPPQPELLVLQQPPSAGSQPILWRWRRWLLDAEPDETAFTVDPVRFVPIARTAEGNLVYDYAGDEGDTIRFGDGLFGQTPDPQDLFRVVYRVADGAAGNVAAGAVARVDPAAAPQVLAVTNPFPAAGGADAEPNQQVQRLAPQAFQARQFRAVRREDYEAAAQTLPWVDHAGTAYRWTGSWLTVFTTVDPLGVEQIPVARHVELIDLLNRYRLAGYESYAPDPHFIALDLVVTVCARADAFRGDVEAAVLAALSSRINPDGTIGFFFADRFTFGTPLERSALEAAIQDAYGVAGVVSVTYRRRGWEGIYREMEEVVPVGKDAILRVDNDPSRPERGSLRVIMEGGK